MKGALQGLRVLEFSKYVAGPWIGKHLAYCGAEVIKVEASRHLESFRYYVPRRNPDGGLQPQRSPGFMEWNSGKRFVSVDLNHATGVGLCKRLASQADIVIENNSAGAIDSLGLGYDVLKGIKPDIIMYSTTGCGDSGPYRRYITFGPNIEAFAGLSNLSGFPHQPCTTTLFAYADALAALHGLYAIMCALDYRDRTGIGQHIKLSQVEATAGSIGHVLMEYTANRREPRRLGNADANMAPHGCYQCKGDDRWCVIAVRSEEEWQSFCRTLDTPEWLADGRFATREARLKNCLELDQLIERWTIGRFPYEVMTILQNAGIPAGVVQTTEDMLRRDPQLAARGFYAEIEHVQLGKVIGNGLPLGLTACPGQVGLAGQPVGYDTDYVFGELLGLAADEIQTLLEKGAISRS